MQSSDDESLSAEEDEHENHNADDDIEEIYIEDMDEYGGDGEGILHENEEDEDE